ncbi:DUF5134 domain-containing protein [Streptomyces sp. NRRL F-5123]|uniref:DUF5134 domain-containing protein n=1 Tax=Streptomyces sp. NRRL F-5123 TaxID=1463856 RepID=UPI0004E14E6A|nr:DUF5134 domain-containing protein [Streptomyces sp. NRRL F-5123]
MDTPVDVVRWILTTLFALVALHALHAPHAWLRGARVPGTGRRDRVDHLLHAAMAVVMAAMPWNLGRSLSGPAMTILFAAAALWFPLTALHRRRADTVAAIPARLLPAAGMAAMAWMPRMRHSQAVPSHETLAGSVPVLHHGAAIAHVTGGPATADLVTGLLAVFLLAGGLRSLNPMPPRVSAVDTAQRAAATDDRYGHLRDGAMALGTAVMLLMPH